MPSLDTLAKQHNTVYYLASPYSHVDPAVRADRNKQIGEVAAKLLARGMFIYSPIWMAHHAAVSESLPGDHNWWWDFNAQMIRRCNAMIVVQLPGWQHSKGIAAEIGYIKGLNAYIPEQYHLYYLNPSTLEVASTPFDLDNNPDTQR